MTKMLSEGKDHSYIYSQLYLLVCICVPLPFTDLLNQTVCLLALLLAWLAATLIYLEYPLFLITTYITTTIAPDINKTKS